MTILTFVHNRDTKNFSVYFQSGNDMNRLYLAKGMYPETFTVEIPEK